MRHRCHNREFPEFTVVQDGWANANGKFGDGMYRVPHMVEIPFKGSRECHQWDKPDGAIYIGVTDPAGCYGCKWVPRNYHTEVRLIMKDGDIIDGINGDDSTFILMHNPAKVMEAYFRMVMPKQGIDDDWHPLVVDMPYPPESWRIGDTVQYRRRW